MKRSDIPDGHVIELARRWREHPKAEPFAALKALAAGDDATLAELLDGRPPGVIAALMAEGVPEKVALAKVLHMCRRGLLEYGTSPYYAWPR